ncbi:uncharacterized protein LOC110457327 [Mizuhopecten yessoensis]|uniref:Uncharacterized protein n=1 Tax=Mizuhopecten yessoensis TaxID=6573 RepID=A0A210Q8W4_MIZYE|nr:uncharacterized protein LOC110457327 [Mizuhopecten yessoensis]OWF45178.1 hypothetical protein KP79_PYT23616 [Mizuhopecten yessoensis]
MASNKIGSGWPNVTSITAPQSTNEKGKSNVWKDMYSKLRKNKKDLRNGYAFGKKPHKYNSPSPALAPENKTNSPVSTVSEQSNSVSASSSSTSGSKSPTTISAIKLFQDSDTQTDNMKNNTDTTDDCIMAMALACIIVLPMAIIVVLVGLATPFWYNTGTGNLGLFQMCYTTSGTCETASSFLSTVSSTAAETWRTVSSLTVVGTSLFLIALIFLCLYMSCKRIDNKKICCGVVICFMLLTGAGCVISGMALTISLYTQIGQNYVLDWSFYLAAVGGGIGFIAFILFAIHVCFLVID